MRIIGVDPGSLQTGYGVVGLEGGALKYVVHGTIKLSNKMRFTERLGVIYDELKNVIDRFRPDGMAIENVFFAKNVQSALKLGQVRGVAILSAIRSGISVYEYSPLQIKQATVGYGRASKEQVFNMVLKLLGLKGNIDYHASDALAVAICHLHTFRAMEILNDSIFKR